ncbi:MAG: GNAT family N-acetyltransferase [Anaerococcus sp.]|nr:GNAT family N-acetyltransferase [Anaerococcus sp.]
MKIRRANVNDLASILKILQGAKKSLRLDGVDQWQKSNPDENLIRGQISERRGLVLVEGEKLLAYAALSKYEITYKVHEDKFLGSNYFVIHTFMVGRPGLGKVFMKELIGFAKALGMDSLRIDTHMDNFRMRRLLDKFSFVYIGPIKIQEEGVLKGRLCFELMI